MMGTNYYHRVEACKTCGHSDNETHIGKSSGGWQFTFHAIHEARSWKHWQLALQEGEIYSEYDEKVPLKEFIELVEHKQKSSKLNHAQEYPNGSWVDDEGYSFSEHEFC